MEYKNVRHKLNTHSRDFNLFLTDVNCSLCERNCSVSSLQLLSWNIFVLHSMSCHPSQSTGRWPIQPAIQAVRHLASLPMTGPSAAATVVRQSRASLDHVAAPRDDDRNGGMPKCQSARMPDGVALPPQTPWPSIRPRACSVAPACNCRCNVARREYNC